MSKRDFYETLGASRSASQDDLKRAYRKAAKELHPDRNKDDPGAEQRFKDLNEAYDVLKDPQKRAAYDQFGHGAFNGGMGGFGGAAARGAGAGQGPDFASAFADVFDDLFGEFMGGRGRGGPARQRGADLRYNMAITLEEAFHGREAQITVPSSAPCETCSGTGAAGGSKPQTCTTCSGAGKVRAQQGFFTVERTCPTCSGRGQIISNPCKSCGGTGQTRTERPLSVDIPAGVEDGTRIRLSGQGEPGAMGGGPGDLYIFLTVEPHPIFKREGPDLFCRIPVPMADAALGGHIEAPTIDGGRARVAIPPGAQSGKQFRLRGKGMPVLRQNRTGDMYIEIVVETPVSLTKKQRELLEEFRKAGDSDANNPESGSFFKRVRDFWDGGR